MGSITTTGRETRRFRTGETVWVSPSVSGHWLCDDEATVIEDLGAGYLVHQTSERVPSNGLGHFVCDLELAALYATPYVPVPEAEIRRDRRLWDFNALTMLGRARCERGELVRTLHRVPAHV